MNFKILKFPQKKVCCFFLFLLTLKLFAQNPTSNPCSIDENHWTNLIKWSNVYDAFKFDGLIQAGNMVDSIVLQKSMNEISRNGGGILYFPAGSYYFNYDLIMTDGVVIRGEASNESNKKTLLTKFIFPRYIPSFTGSGTPNNTAFKKIYAGSRKKNFGIVNIDINRAVINLKILEDKAPFHDNVVLYGLRQNNVALLDPRFPSKIQSDEKHEWQRWPLWNGDNIGLSFENNAIVSNCILNDSITDDFYMPNYMTNDGYIFEADTLRFRYGLHTGINIYEYNSVGNKNIEITNNVVVIPKSAIEQYLHPGIALYVANKYNEKDKAILYDFIKVPKSKAFTYILPNYIHVNNNIINYCKDEKENLLVERKFHYSNIYQNNVKEHFQRKTYLGGAKDTLLYYFKTPENVNPRKKYPLVLFFHGTGEIGGDNPLIHFVNMFAKEKINSNHPCYIIVPQLKKNDSWVSLAEAPPTPSINLTFDLIKDIIKDYRIDKRKIYIAGVSYGCSGVFEMLTKKDNIFSKAIVTSYLFNTNNPRKLKSLKRTDFQITTGLSDSNLPPAYMRLMVNDLRNAGINVRYNEYKIGHFSWIPLTADEEFVSWLFEKK